MQMNESAPLGTFNVGTRSYGMASYKPPRGYEGEQPPDRSHNERGGFLVMTESEAYDMRERLRAVEIQIRYMNDEVKELRDEMKDVGASLRGLTDLVASARGAKYAISLGFMAIGALAAFAPTLIKVLFALK